MSGVEKIGLVKEEEEHPCPLSFGRGIGCLQDGGCFFAKRVGLQRTKLNNQIPLKWNLIKKYKYSYMSLNHYTFGWGGDFLYHKIMLDSETRSFMRSKCFS